VCFGGRVTASTGLLTVSKDVPGLMLTVTRVKTTTATKSVGSRIANFVKGLFSFDGFAVPAMA
jgi:hypothetical protein